MTEQQIQTKIKKKLEKEGWYVVKLIKTSVNGIMDLLCLRDGKAMFIEVKKQDGVLSELQKLRLKELTKKGFECKVWTDYQIEFKTEVYNGD